MFAANSEGDNEACTPKSDSSKLATNNLKSSLPISQQKQQQQPNDYQNNNNNNNNMKNNLSVFEEIVARQKRQSFEGVESKLLLSTLSSRPGNKTARSHIPIVPRLDLGSRTFSINNSSIPASARAIPNTTRAEQFVQNTLYNSKSSNCNLEDQFKLYDALDTFEEIGGDQDQFREKHINGYEDGGDTITDDDDGESESIASLSTIAPSGYKIAPSIASMRPNTGRRRGVSVSMTGVNGMMQGATNILFQDGNDFEEDEDEDYNCEDVGICDLAIPMLVNMMESQEIEVATSSATELALKIQKEPSVIKELVNIGIINVLVKLMESASSELRAAVVRIVGILGEKSPEMQLQIVNSEIFQKLNKMTKMTTTNDLEAKDEVASAAGWAINRISAFRPTAPSVEISVPMLIDILMMDEPGMSEGAILEINEKLQNVNADMVIKDLIKADITYNLLNLLESECDDVQSAAANILSHMAFHDQSTHIKVASGFGISARLIRMIKNGNERCKKAAAKVIRCLIQNNPKFCGELIKKDMIADFASLLVFADREARENSCWILGTLASHSEAGNKCVESCDQALFILNDITERGDVAEKAAAQWALRQVDASCCTFDNNDDDDDDCELSIPLVIKSLQTGNSAVKVAAIWELFRKASNNSWSQVEISENDGISAILNYLKSKPGQSGIQASLSTLLTMAKSESRIAASICCEGAVTHIVKLLKAYNCSDKKLIIELLTVLAEKCPLHQQEVISNGAVPVLVEMLLADDTMSKLAYEALNKLVDSDLSIVSMTAADQGTEAILDILKEESPSYAKEGAANLLEKIVLCNYDAQEQVLRLDGMSVLLDVMENDENEKVKEAAARVASKLASRELKAKNRSGGNKAFPSLINVLENSAFKSRKHRTSGLMRPMSDVIQGYGMSSPHTSNCDSCQSTTSNFNLKANFTRQGSFSAHSRTSSCNESSKIGTLPVVQESVAEDSDIDETILFNNQGNMHNASKDWENKSDGKQQSPEPLDNVTESDDEQPVPLPEMVPLTSATSKDILMTPRKTPFNIEDSYCSNNIYNGFQQQQEQEQQLPQLQQQINNENDQKLQQLQYEQKTHNMMNINNITRQNSGNINAPNTARGTTVVVPPLATKGYNMKGNGGMPERNKKEIIRTKKKINDLVNEMRNGDGNHRDAAVRSLTSLVKGGNKQARLHAVKSDCFKLMVEHIQAKCYK